MAGHTGIEPVSKDRQSFILADELMTLVSHPRVEPRTTDRKSVVITTSPMGHIFQRTWYLERISKSQPIAYEATALSFELPRHKKSPTISCKAHFPENQ